MAREANRSGKGQRTRYEVTKSQMPIVPLSVTLPGIRVRMLADRDAGVVVWESSLLDDAGTVVSTDPPIRLSLPHLMNLDEIVDLLFQARDALTPRRRLDMTQLEAPAVDIPESVQKVGG